MNFDSPYLNDLVLGVALIEYIKALFFFVLIYILLRLFKNVGLHRLEKVTGKLHSTFDSVFIKILTSLNQFFYLTTSLYFALLFTNFPDMAKKISLYLFVIVLTFYLGKSMESIIDFFVSRVLKKEEDKDNKVVVRIISQVVKVVLWLIIILLILQNLGYNVSTLIGGLGIGGIAVAFALQNILEDLFAYLSIHLDKPFKEGDFIITKEVTGTVKHVGLKSTRLQALQGEEIIVSNKFLINNQVSNYKKLKKRRTSFTISVAYDTSNDKLEKIPAIITKIFSRLEEAELDRVHFKSFGDFSLMYEVVYFVNNKEYNVYMNIQQAFNLALKKKFEEEKIKMAYATQRVLISK